jgi:hypothetical protein
VLWMNTVGPYHNRQETYGYYTLPFCMGPKESIGRRLTPPQFLYGTGTLLATGTYVNATVCI